MSPHTAGHLEDYVLLVADAVLCLEVSFLMLRNVAMDALVFDYASPDRIKASQAESFVVCSHSVVLVIHHESCRH